MRSLPFSGSRKLTELDFIRLENLALRGRLPQLTELLGNVDVVAAEAIPADVVTMNSKFILFDLSAQRRQVLTVCYPRDVDPARGMISVLSPAGLGLIGLQAGSIARWVRPSGEETIAQIEEVLLQPEAAGDYAS
jgi:regulator of nucleoside diphosphate kinase